MTHFLGNLKTILLEAIGLIGGLIWAIHTNWDYEPVILVILSLIGLSISIVLRFRESDENRPYVQLEMICLGCQRSNPRITRNSPRTEGGFALFENYGKYFFIIKWNYQIIIRNNSNSNAYEVNIKVNKKYLKNISFHNNLNYLEPIIIDKPKVLNLSFEIKKEMNHKEAHRLYSNQYPTEIRKTDFLIEYKNEARDKKYFLLFKVPRDNKLMSPRNVKTIVNEHVKI